jgi:mannose-6-phosphate isomerase-like protein (cupin superfamily)
VSNGTGAIVRRVEDVRVDKPWGYELRFAITERYLGKLIHVNQGEALSLQYHEQKDETLLVTLGEMDLELEGDDGTIAVHRMRTGDCVRVVPGRRHRMTAVQDSTTATAAKVPAKRNGG